MTPLLWFDIIATLVIAAFWLGLEVGWRTWRGSNQESKP